MKRSVWLGLLALAALPINVGKAESIWTAATHVRLIFCRQRARNIGDMLTITAARARPRTKPSRQLDKTTSGSLTTDLRRQLGLDQQKCVGLYEPCPHQRDHSVVQWHGEFDQRPNIRGQNGGTVVDMMPNGNLVVEGYRSRIVSGEERMLRITGVVRQQDIGTANTVHFKFCRQLPHNVSWTRTGDAICQPKLFESSDEPALAVVKDDKVTR